MKRILLTLLVVLGLGTSFAFAHPATSVYADAKSEICSGVGAASSGTGCTAAAGQPTVNSLVKTIVTVLSWIVGVLSIIMIVFAGFMYVSSGGEPNKVSAAKNTLIYAIVGIVIVAFAQAIVQFVLGKV